MRVQSEPGRGSTFRVYLPARATDESRDVARHNPALSGKGERVLFVDDESALCHASRAVLERVGYRVATHTDPVSALETLPFAELGYAKVDHHRALRLGFPEVVLGEGKRPEQIIGIVRRIAAQDGYEIILEKASVPYMRADLEITDRAIQMYNSGQGGDAGAKPPATTPPAATGKPAAPAPAPKKK